MQIALIRSVHLRCQSVDPTNQISQTLGAYITLVTIQLSLHLPALDRCTLHATRFLIECACFVCHRRAKISLPRSPPPTSTHFFNLCENAELLPVISRAPACGCGPSRSCVWATCSSAVGDCGACAQVCV